MTVKFNYVISQKVLQEVALGKNTSIPRGIALKMLPESNVPNPDIIFKTVLEDETDKAQFRRMAAISLWKINTPRALGYLLEAAGKIKEPEVLVAIVKGLGRSGDANALKAIQAIDTRGNKVLEEQALFASSLISYRLGLPSHDLKIPREFVAMPPAENVELNFISPAKIEIDLFLSCLAIEPYGIEFSEESMLQYKCPGGVSMLALNREMSKGNAHELLMKRKNLLGVLAPKNSEDGRYSVSYLILSSPDAANSKVNILIHRVTGEQAWAGTSIPVSGTQVNFTLSTAARLGIVPLELKGTITQQGKITITKAISAGKVLEKKRPVRIDFHSRPIIL